MTVRLDTAKLDMIIARFPKESAEVVKSGAYAVMGRAMTKAPVDTGALKNSIHTKQVSDLLWWVQDGVEYGIYQELKLGRGKCTPFMRPAVEDVQKYYTGLWVALFNRL